MIDHDLVSLHTNEWNCATKRKRYSAIELVVVILSPAGSVCGINNKLLLMEYVALTPSPSWNLLITHLSDLPVSIQEKPMLNLLFPMSSYIVIRGAPFPGFHI